MEQAEQRLIPWWPDAANALGIRRTKIYELIRDGDLPSLTIGRRRLVSVRDIDEYIERRLEANAGEPA